MVHTTSLKPRLDMRTVAPAAAKAMLTLEAYARTESRIEPPLGELVRLRASQINGCAYCLDMHAKDARAAGESEQRIYALNAWRETPFYTARERAALEWTEAITLIGESRAPDDIYELVRSWFSDEEMVDLTMLIVTINGWNRLMMGFRVVPGEYRAATRAHSG